MRAVLSVLGETVLPAICLVGIGYNILVMLNAPEGMRMNSLLQQELVESKAQLAALRGEYAHLSDRADRLMTATLDQDLLEERVRAVLGLARPNELMVRMEDLDRLAQIQPTAPNYVPDDPVDQVTLAALEDQPRPWDRAGRVD